MAGLAARLLDPKRAEEETRRTDIQVAGSEEVLVTKSDGWIQGVLKKKADGWIQGVAHEESRWLDPRGAHEESRWLDPRVLWSEGSGCMLRREQGAG